MNKLSATILEIALKESLRDYELKENSNSLEGLYLYYDNEENLLIIYDNAEHVLNKIQLPDDQPINLSNVLRQIFHQANRDRLFEKDYIIKPFTVNLIDKDFVVLEELFYLDNSILKHNDSIWTNIERDLDDFIENLLQ